LWSLSVIIATAFLASELVSPRKRKNMASQGKHMIGLLHKSSSSAIQQSVATSIDYHRFWQGLSQSATQIVLVG
jgi:hypothetical protein